MRSNMQLWGGLALVTAAIGGGGAAYLGTRPRAEPAAGATKISIASATASTKSGAAFAAPTFDPRAFKVVGVWQLSDDASNSWCVLGIYHIDDDGTYWVDRGWQNEQFGNDEGKWAVKPPSAKSRKGVKAVLVFTPRAGPGRQAYRFEIRSSDRFRFSAFGFEDGDGPTGENITRVEFEQISNQTVLDAFSQDCGAKPGEPINDEVSS